MAHPRLTILNVLPAEAWEAESRKPRFLQPHEFSVDPCAHCVGNCCFAQVRVTTVEALRIALTLALPVLDVVQVSAAPDEKSNQDHRIPVPIDTGPVRFSLHVQEGHRCMFLYHVGPRGRCAIHGLRPGPCRIYPFHLVVGKRAVAVGSQSMCPIKWLQDDPLRDRVAADLAAWDADIAREKKLISAWKRHKGTDRSLHAYFTFAIEQLASSFGKDPRVVLAPPRRRLGEGKT